MLDALGRAGAQATFFLVGERAVRHPEVVHEIVAGGHTVAVHGYRHRNQMRLSGASVAADLRHAVREISALAGTSPRFYRPPYGAFTAGGLVAVRRAGLLPLLWSKWGRDWEAGPPQRIARLATEGLAAGDVVLLHDADWYSTPGAHRCTARAPSDPRRDQAARRCEPIVPPRTKVYAS